LLSSLGHKPPLVGSPQAYGLRHLTDSPICANMIIARIHLGKKIAGGEQGSTGQVEVEVACPGCQEAW